MTLRRRDLPPLNALRAFEVAGRRLSFRAAAEELGVSQGAVAQQVRLLEDHLGRALFRRLPRGLALTEAGASYLGGVLRAFDGLCAATEALQAQPGGLTISVTPTFATRLLIPRLAAFNRALPGVELRIVATEALADFERDRVDLAVRLGRPPFPPGLEARLLFRQELVAVASPHLPGAEAPLPRAALLELPLLHDAQDGWPRFLGAAPRRAGARFNQTALALDAALAAQGVALACRAFVAEDLAAGRLVQLCPETLAAGPDYYLLRRAGGLRGNTAAAWDWCLATLGAEPG